MLCFLLPVALVQRSAQLVEAADGAAAVVESEIEDGLA